ncbi:hypothetical protein ACYOEI_33935 [Singulisphaera rosea]
MYPSRLEHPSRPFVETPSGRHTVGSGAQPSFRIVPRCLVLREACLDVAPASRPSGGPLSGRVVLEYDETSGHVAPVWVSVKPDEAVGQWRLQVTPQFEEMVAVLVHRGVPLIWLNAHWNWVGANRMTPVSPSYLSHILRPVEITPA